MSRSAGTLQTTHQATYIPPRMMPGYKGHCPTAKFDYGETYGNATAKYFQDYRSQTLNESKSHYAKGGQFPTVYTHNPDLVIHARDRTREQWRTAPKYGLTNVNHDRKEEIDKFDKLAQEHRQYYKDRTATVQRVNEFLIPKSAEEMYRQDVKSIGLLFVVLGILIYNPLARLDINQSHRGQLPPAEVVPIPLQDTFRGQLGQHALFQALTLTNANGLMPC